MVADAVDSVVEAQIEAGVDIVSDGEVSKPSYTNYLKDRLNGFGDAGEAVKVAKDLEINPNFLAMLRQEGKDNPLKPPACIGPISTKDRAPLETDLANFGAAVARHCPTGSFMSSASPGVVAIFMPNEYYSTEDEYVFALADAMQEEFEAIANAGFVLQVDAPDLAMGRHTFYKDLPLEEFRKKGRTQRRSPEPCDAKYRAGADADTPVLGQLPRPAYLRCGPGQDLRHRDEGPAHDLPVRGRQPASCP